VYAATSTAVRSLTSADAASGVGLYRGGGPGLEPAAVWGAIDADLQEASSLAAAGGGLTDGARTSVNPLRHDGAQRGMLVVCCPDAMTLDVHGALCSLASQTALALESVTLAATARALRQDTRFKSLIQNASDLLIVVSADGSVAYASPSVQRRLGWSPQTLEGAGFDVLFSPGDAALARRVLAELIHRGAGAHVVVDCRLRRAAGGGTVAFEAIAQNLLSDPDVAGVVVTLRDVSERRELERQLAHQAFHDALTGLANRALVPRPSRAGLGADRATDRPRGHAHAGPRRI